MPRDAALVTAVRAALDRAGQELEAARVLVEQDGAASLKLAIRLALFEVRQAIRALDAPAQAEPPAVASVDVAGLTVTLLADQGPVGAPRYRVVDVAGSGEPHLVTVTPPWCNCPDFRYRREIAGEFCKHISAAAHVQERTTSASAPEENLPPSAGDADVAPALGAVGPHDEVEAPAPPVAEPSAAALIVTPLEAGRLGEERFHVVDPAGSGTPWLVVVLPTGPLCECPSFRNPRKRRRHCKHVAAVLRFRKARPAHAPSASEDPR